MQNAAVLADRPRTITREAQLRREAALCEPGRIINIGALDLACRVRGWSRSRLAVVMHMERAHVGRVINGDRLLTPEFRWRLVQALQVAEPDELFIPAPADQPRPVELDEDAA